MFAHFRFRLSTSQNKRDKSFPVSSGLQFLQFLIWTYLEDDTQASISYQLASCLKKKRGRRYSGLLKLFALSESIIFLHHFGFTKRLWQFTVSGLICRCRFHWGIWNQADILRDAFLWDDMNQAARIWSKNSLNPCLGWIHRFLPRFGTSRSLLNPSPIRKTNMPGKKCCEGLLESLYDPGDLAPLPHFKPKRTKYESANYGISNCWST